MLLLFSFFSSALSRAFLTHRLSSPVSRPSFAARLIRLSHELVRERINRGWLWCRVNSYVVSILSSDVYARIFPPSKAISNVPPLEDTSSSSFHDARRLRSINSRALVTRCSSRTGALYERVIRNDAAGWLESPITTYSPACAARVDSLKDVVILPEFMEEKSYVPILRVLRHEFCSALLK